jgi:hypothetical protein
MVDCVRMCGCTDVRVLHVVGVRRAGKAYALEAGAEAAVCAFDAGFEGAGVAPKFGGGLGM